MTLKSKDPVKIISVRGTSFAPVEGEGKPASEQAPSGDFAAPKTSFVSQELTKSERPELTAAKVVISGGMIRMNILPTMTLNLLSFSFSLSQL